MHRYSKSSTLQRLSTIVNKYLLSLLCLQYLYTSYITCTSNIYYISSVYLYLSFHANTSKTSYAARLRYKTSIRQGTVLTIQWLTMGLLSTRLELSGLPRMTSAETLYTLLRGTHIETHTGYSPLRTKLKIAEFHIHARKRNSKRVASIISKSGIPTWTAT